MEKLCVVRRKRTAMTYVPWILGWILTAFLTVLFLGQGSITLLFAAITVGVLNVFFLRPRDISFDYTYYDGEMTVARIRGDNRRKLLTTIRMEEVEKIAPSDDGSLYGVEHEQGTVVRDYSSHTGKAPTYKLVHRAGGKATIYIIEPSDEFLDEIAVRFSRIVPKRA